MEEALRASGFAKPSQSFDQVPAVKKQELEEEIRQIRDEIRAVEEKLRAYGTSRENIRLLSDYCRMRAEKYQALGNMLQSGKTLFLQALCLSRRKRSFCPV